MNKTTKEVATTSTVGDSYEFHGMTIPARMLRLMEDWVAHATPPGDFLMAVINNDLQRAVIHADAANVSCIPVFVAWFYNEAPGLCWGSEEKAANWKGLLNRPTGGTL